MPKKPAEQLFETTRYQEIIAFQEKYSIKKSISNIPFVVTFQKKLNFDLMQKAVETEIQRNDVLRVMGYKEKGKTYQYFKASVEIGKIPYVNFTGKTEEEQTAYFQKISNKGINYCKELSYKFVFFTGFDGKDGFYFVQNHNMNDTGGILIMINDLMKVYDHLAEGGEMPKELGTFQGIIEKQNKSFDNKEKVEGDIAFFRRYFKECGEPVYMAPYENDLLAQYRKKTKKPEINCANAMAMYSGKTHIQRLEFTGELYNKIMKCCEECHTSVQNFFYLLIRLQCYRLTGITDCMQSPMTSGNRATVIEKRTSGMMLNNFYMEYPYEGEKKICDVFGEVQAVFNDLYKYKTLGGMKALDYFCEAWPHKATEFYASATISVVPAFFDFPKEYGIMISWLPPQVLPMPGFHVIVHDMLNDRIQYNFQYTLKFVTDEATSKMFDDMKKLAEVMADHPDWTEDQITKAVK